MATLFEEQQQNRIRLCIMSAEIQHKRVISGRKGGGEDSFARLPLNQSKHRADLIISFLEDPSEAIRTIAARALQAVDVLPERTATRLMTALVRETMPQVKQELIKSVPRLVGGRSEFVPVLLGHLGSTEHDLRVAAADTLGALGRDAEHAFIPFAVLSSGAGQMGQDERVLAFKEALSEETRALFEEYEAWVSEVTAEPPSSSMAISFRTARIKDLSLLARETALNVCLGSQKLACAFLDVWINSSEGATLSDESGFLEAALAFKIREVSQKPKNEATIRKFYEGCRSTRLESGLEYALSIAPRVDDSVTEAHLDFSIAQLGRGWIQEEALGRLVSGLWSAKRGRLRHLGSNVAVLSDSLDRQQCGGVLKQLWQLYDARKDEIPDVKAAILSIISKIPDSDDHSLGRCEGLAQDHLSDQTRRQLLQLIDNLQGTSKEMEPRKVALQNYLRR